MRWLVIVVVIAVAAFFGYRYLYPDQSQQLAEQAEQAAEQAAQQVEEAAEAVTEEVEEATDQAADTAQQAGESTEQAADQAAELTEQTAEQAAESTEQTAEQAAELTEQTADQAVELTEQAADQAADTAQQATEQAAQSVEDTTAALTVEGVNLGQEVGTTVSDAVNTLGGITDKASAEAALPNLEALDTKLGELGGKVDQLSESGKESLASLLDDMLPEMQDLVNKVEGIEGVGEVVKPTLDSIMTKLDGWAKQPA